MTIYSVSFFSSVKCTGSCNNATLARRVWCSSSVCNKHERPLSTRRCILSHCVSGSIHQKLNTTSTKVPTTTNKKILTTTTARVQKNSATTKPSTISARIQKPTVTTAKTSTKKVLTTQKIATTTKKNIATTKIRQNTSTMKTTRRTG